MVFSGLPFLFFFLPAFFICYFTAKKRAARNIVLLIFSLFFYAWGEPLYILLLMFSVAFNYFCARLIDRSKKSKKSGKTELIINIIGNLLLITVFKYTGLLADLFGGITGQPLDMPGIILPIGISFYTFQIMSYVIDVYRGNVPVQNNILFLGAYLCSFPQLIAGPIVRYQTIADELVSRSESFTEFTAGLRRFVIGLAKKVLIANTMASAVDTLLGYTPADYGAVGAWIAIAAYSLQIFFDFSGYSDMAIGMGRMMGFHYLENFEYPYTAATVTGFWRRWHISLSTFFRDYVYIPMGGNCVGRGRWIFNMLVVWLLTGLWHGASLTFVLWGIYYGVLLILEKFFYGKWMEKHTAAGHIYTIAAFVFGWVIFRSETFARMGDILSAMAGLYGAGGGGNLSLITLFERAGINFGFVIIFIAAVLLCTPALKRFAAASKENGDSAALCYTADAGLLILFIFCVISLAAGSYNPFIYFRF
ncbi:MAG: MBOAT family O-acyltransferase [Eubacteriales bacterium]